MKLFQKKYIAFLFIVLSQSSCTKNDENQVNPSSNITFSNSPFDLQGINAKFAKDIAYDNKARTQFDIWLPNSNTPTGLVIYVHGGGFTSGDKDLYMKLSLVVRGIFQPTLGIFFKIILRSQLFDILI